METTLKQLYEGRLSPMDQYLPQDEDYIRMQNASIDHCDALAQKLKALEPALSDSFNRIVDEIYDLSTQDCSRMFIEGFRLGARMMIEVLQPQLKH